MGSPQGCWFDAGCGNLPASKWILEKAQGNIQIWAGDIDIDGANEVIGQIKDSHLITIVHTDLRERWPFPNDFFDGIVGNHVFTFLTKSQKMGEEAWSVKRSSPGGLQGFKAGRNINLDYAKEKCQYVVWIVILPEILIRPFPVAETWALSPFDYVEDNEIYSRSRTERQKGNLYPFRKRGMRENTPFHRFYRFRMEGYLCQTILAKQS